MTPVDGQNAEILGPPHLGGPTSLNFEMSATIALFHCPARFGCFSNRPFWVKRFQTIHQCCVDVAHGVGLDDRGAIVLRQKWSRGQIEARLHS